MNENYIEFTTSELHRYTTELYEAMFEDMNDKEINDLCRKMIEILKDVQSSLDKS